MSTLKKLKLRQEADTIMKDLDVDHVLADLLCRRVLDEEEVELINSEKTRRTKALHLLDLIQKKEESHIDGFVSVLKEDYSWLHQKLSSFDVSDSPIVSEIDSEQNVFYDVLLVGGVPHPPPYNVKREQKLSEIRNCLRNLKRGHYLVLHGMTGSGKSCLAAGSVEDKEIVMDVLKGCVFWMTVGCSAKDDILSCMIDLLDRLKMTYGNLSPVEAPVILDKVKAKERLKHLFLDERLREGLLILDDVPSAEFIESFDFGCKIMITTKDLSVMASVKGRYDVVEVKRGFTENESLSLLANSVNLTLDKLPREAKRIHELSQGFPMILALLAGQLEDNKEDAQSSEGRWKHCVGLLSNKFEFIRRKSMSENDDGLFKTIEYSITELPRNFKERYFFFAVFMEDVNIKPEVLQILWSCDTKYEAEDIMSVFIKKSLAVKKWNEQFRCSIYGIHDLLLHYLKNQFSNPEDRIALHKTLLRRYHEVCKGKYAELPNDNYIHSYIGYHLNEAQEWAKFQDLFFDLRFIQSKVRITGPADLLRDYKKYEKQIINGNEQLQAKLKDYVQFIEDCGVYLYICHDMDIIQYGLLREKNSHVYQDAYKLAVQNPERLYLEFLTDQGFVSQRPVHIIPMAEEICAACFVNEETILIATNSAVQLWHLKHYELFKKFYGHKKKILGLKVHPDGKSFLSYSADGTVKLWSLHSLWSDISNGRLHKSASENFKTSTPSALQKNWNSMFLDNTKDESMRTSPEQNGPILDAKFSHSGEDILFCCEDSVIIWNHARNTTQKVTQNTSSDGKFVHCLFSYDDSLVFIGRANASLSVYNATTLDFVASFSNSSRIVDVFSVKYEKNKVLVVSQNDLCIWHWEECFLPTTCDRDSSDHITPTLAAAQISYCTLGDKESSATYVCAAFSDDNILVVATSDFMISIWDVKRKALISEHRNYRGVFSCLDTYVSDTISLLMCGEDRTVKIWHLAKIGSESSLNLKLGFHAVWDSSKNPSALPLISSPDSENSLQILQGSSLIAKTPLEKREILSTTISSSLSAVFYGCADGNVKKYNIADKSLDVIMKLDTGVTYLQSFYCGEEILVAGDERNLKLCKEDNTVLMCYGQTSPVIRCFYIPRTVSLLACNQDAGVKLWNITSGKLSQVIIGHSKGTEIVSADLSEDCETLVLCDKACTVRVASLCCNVPNITLTSLKHFNTETELGFITSCKISPVGQLLALGFQSGCIQLWDLQLKQLLRKLELHKSPVRDLHFAPSCEEINSERFFVLVSVGEKIGWWKIKSSSLADRMSNYLCQLRPFKPERENTGTSSSLNLWANKKGNPEKNILLGCVDLVGSHALRIYCNSDFSQFVTIDTSGILYVLKVV